MTYSPRPNPSGDTLVASRDQIRTNFEVIRDRFQDDHTDYSSGSGKHDKMTMPDQSTVPTTAANEGALYVKDATGSNLFFRSESNGKEYQMTRVLDAQFDTYFGKNAAYTKTAIDYTGGFTFLPGGLIMIYGTLVNAVSINTFTIEFPFSFPNNAFFVNITGIRAGTSPGSNTDAWVIDGSLTTSQFQIFNNGGHNFRYQWQAIGN